MSEKKKHKFYVVKHGALEFTVGNLKLGTDTMIFNMGSAFDCPSLKRGLCKLGKKCYAMKPERQYPKCKPYRDRQADYWLHNSSDKIALDFYHALTTRRVKVNGKLTPIYKIIKYFRFNESGDFYSRVDVHKLHNVAGKLKKFFNIKTYGYTARSDLFYKNDLNFNIKGSGWSGPNGKTIAVLPKLIKGKKYIDKDGTEYVVCPMDCRTCNFCQEGNLNIAFPLHDKKRKA